MELSPVDRRLLRSKFTLCEARNVVSGGVVASIDYGIDLTKRSGDTIRYYRGDPVIAYETGDKVEFVKCRT
jgi:hypothetical protein